jgi:hypothetical protein
MQGRQFPPKNPVTDKRRKVFGKVLRQVNPVKVPIRQPFRIEKS